MQFKIKRVYEPAQRSDCTRILVDRLWPRGLKKSKAHIYDWMTEIARSPQLRTWFGHKPERFTEFSARYKKELTQILALTELHERGSRATILLLYAARDRTINQAAVFLSVLRGGSRAPRKQKSPS